MPDTIRTLECYADVIVLRHPETGSAAIAAKAAKKPVKRATTKEKAAKKAAKKATKKVSKAGAGKKEK